MSDAILALEHISRSFFGIGALRDVSLSLGRGRILGGLRCASTSA